MKLPTARSTFANVKAASSIVENFLGVAAGTEAAAGVGADGCVVVVGVSFGPWVGGDTETEFAGDVGSGIFYLLIFLFNTLRYAPDCPFQCFTQRVWLRIGDTSLYTSPLLSL